MKTENPHPIIMDSEPRVIKISKMPLGASVIKLNPPFNLRHLAQRGISRAWVIASTQKSVGTIVGGNIKKVKEIKKLCTDLVYANHPALPKRGIRAQICISLNLGANPRGTFPGSFKWVGNVQALVNDLDDCGFSDIPLTAFVVPLNENLPYTEWIQFTRQAQGFVAVAIGNRLYNKYRLSELKEILSESTTLQKLRAYICQIYKVTQETYTCKVEEENEPEPDEVFPWRKT